MELGGTVMGYFEDATMAEPCALDQEPSKFSSGAAPPSSDNYFDCSICLDFAVDPVVTLCGHLYCWPCIYKWLNVETDSPQDCPVCKAPLSENALVPLYGRGGITTKGTHQSLKIPKRPSVVRDNHSSHSSNSVEYIDRQPLQNLHYYPYYSNGGRDYPPSSSSLASVSPFGTGALHSTAGGVLGDIAVAILPWVTGNHHHGGGGMYLSSSPHHIILSNGNSPSQRRQEMRIENSLHQLWVFLFCCVVLCLLFF